MAQAQYMKSSARIAPSAYMALRKALACTTHFRDEQRRLVYTCLGADHFKVMSDIPFSGQHKAKSADEVVDRLIANEDEMKEVSIDMMLSLSQMSRFPDIERQLEPERSGLLAAARESVEELKKYIDPFIERLNRVQKIQEEREREEALRAHRRVFDQGLSDLQDRFLALQQELNPQQRGRDFENLVYDLFQLHDFRPKHSYSLEYEQIDGYFEFQGDGFIVECKWEQENSGVNIAHILTTKVKEKGRNTLGVLVTHAGLAKTTIERYSTASTFMSVTGHELYLVLDGRISLEEMLKEKRRHLYATGSCYFPYLDS